MDDPGAEGEHVRAQAAQRTVVEEVVQAQPKRDPAAKLRRKLRLEVRSRPRLRHVLHV